MDKNLERLYDRREELCYELIEADGISRRVVEKELEALEFTIEHMEIKLGVISGQESQS